MTDADYGNLIVMGKVTEAGLLAMLGNDHSRLVRVKREAVLMRQQQQRRVSYEGRGRRSRQAWNCRGEGREGAAWSEGNLRGEREYTIHV
jgi:hypothetical protein